MLDLREQLDDLRGRWHARRSMSERVGDGWDTLRVRWGELPPGSRMAGAGAGAVGLIGAGVVGFLLIRPALDGPAVSTTPTTVLVGPTTTSIDLTQLLETPVTDGTTTTAGPDPTASTSRSSSRTTRTTAATVRSTPTTQRSVVATTRAPTTRPPATRPPTTRPATTAPPTTPPPTSPPSSAAT